MDNFAPLLVMFLFQPAKARSMKSHRPHQWNSNEHRYQTWADFGFVGSATESTASDCGITIYKLRWQQLISENFIDYCDHVPHHQSRHWYMFQTFQENSHGKSNLLNPAVTKNSLHLFPTKSHITPRHLGPRHGTPNCPIHQPRNKIPSNVAALAWKKSSSWFCGISGMGTTLMALKTSMTLGVKTRHSLQGVDMD